VLVVVFNAATAHLILVIMKKMLDETTAAVSWRCRKFQRTKIDSKEILLGIPQRF
jgi:hypothetical protein